MKKALPLPGGLGMIKGVVVKPPAKAPPQGCTSKAPGPVHHEVPVPAPTLSKSAAAAPAMTPSVESYSPAELIEMASTLLTLAASKSTGSEKVADA